MRSPEASEELDFQSTFEALFVRAYGELLTPGVKEKLREVGLDLDRPLLPAYPRKVFSAACEILARELHPELPREEAFRLMGRRTLEGFSKTLLGSAVMGVFKLIGVRRGLQRLTRMFRSGDNYTDHRVDFVGERAVEVWVSQVNGQPGYTLGMFEAGLDWVGARNPRARILRVEGDSATFLLEWEDNG